MRVRRELALFAAAYVLYNAGRGLTDGDMGLAVSNAQWVLDFQGGSVVERGVQDALGGFAMAIGMAVCAAVSPRWLKMLALSWGPIVALSTVATANHYLFDVVAGLLITVVGYAAVTYRPQLRPVLVPAT